MLKQVVLSITTEQIDFLDCLAKLKFCPPVSYTKTLKSKKSVFVKDNDNLISGPEWCIWIGTAEIRRCGEYLYVRNR